MINKETLTWSTGNQSFMARNGQEAICGFAVDKFSGWKKPHKKIAVWWSTEPFKGSMPLNLVNRESSIGYDHPKMDWRHNFHHYVEQKLISVYDAGTRKIYFRFFALDRPGKNN